METWFVLWIVTVEKEAGLVRGAEQRLGDERAAVPVDDGARLQRSAADLQIIMYGFGGEVEELDVDPWGQNTQWAQKQKAGVSFSSVSYQNQWVSSLSMCSLIHLGSCQGNRGLKSLHLHLS